MPRIGKFGTPRVRDTGSEAYSSAGKNKFRTKLTIDVDFSDAERSLRSARRSLEDMNHEARQLAKKLNTTNRGYGVYISANAVRDRNAQGNQLLSFNIPAIEKEGEFSASLNPFLTEIGKMGKDIMKNKYATRRETGLMNSSVGYMQRRSGKTRAIVEIGWVRTWKKYFGWQEMGTSTGIKPMAAVIRTGIEMQREVQPIYSKYFRKTFLEKGR
jgi:hypothetical protein